MRTLTSTHRRVSGVMGASGSEGGWPGELVELRNKPTRRRPHRGGGVRSRAQEDGV